MLVPNCCPKRVFLAFWDNECSKYRHFNYILPRGSRVPWNKHRRRPMFTRSLVPRDVSQAGRVLSLKFNVQGFVFVVCLSVAPKGAKDIRVDFIPRVRFASPGAANMPLLSELKSRLSRILFVPFSKTQNPTLLTHMSTPSGYRHFLEMTLFSRFARFS